MIRVRVFGWTNGKVHWGPEFCRHHLPSNQNSLVNPYQENYRFREKLEPQLTQGHVSVLKVDLTQGGFLEKFLSNSISDQLLMSTNC